MTEVQKKKLIELRCKAWGITEDEYYWNQCSDFKLEYMTKAYRRGKNKGRADLEKENAELKDKLKNLASVAEVRLANWQKYEKENVELKESITKFSKNGLDFLHSMKSNRNCIDCESKMSIQLTKAKDIMKRLVDLSNSSRSLLGDTWFDTLREAEQFLKDNEVKNALS